MDFTAHSAISFYNMRQRLNLILLAWVLWFCSGISDAAEEPPVRFGAFNIRAFGRSKLNKPEVVSIIVQVSKKKMVLGVWSPILAFWTRTFRDNASVCPGERYLYLCLHLIFNLIRLRYIIRILIKLLFYF